MSVVTSADLESEHGEEGRTQLLRPFLKQKTSSGSGNGTRLEEKSFKGVNEKTKSLFRPNVLTLMQGRILAQRRTLSMDRGVRFAQAIMNPLTRKSLPPTRSRL